jgi:hypothetical protein
MMEPPSKHEATPPALPVELWIRGPAALEERLHSSGGDGANLD